MDAIIRRAVPTEAEHLADIGFRAWERDLKPFLSGAAASPSAEQHRLRQVVHELFDRIIVAEVEGDAVGWCARARSRPYIPYLFVMPEM
jgi:ribosomal-protein-alanine N-acetyltransferase